LQSSGPAGGHDLLAEWHREDRPVPGIAGALASLGKRLKATVVLDGEIVAVDKAGTPLGFQHIPGTDPLNGPAEIRAR
jgi:hypothetical protein